MHSLELKVLRMRLDMSFLWDARCDLGGWSYARSGTDTTTRTTRVLERAPGRTNVDRREPDQTSGDSRMSTSSTDAQCGSGSKADASEFLPLEPERRFTISQPLSRSDICRPREIGLGKHDAPFSFHTKTTYVCSTRAFVRMSMRPLHFSAYMPRCSHGHDCSPASSPNV